MIDTSIAKLTKVFLHEITDQTDEQNTRLTNQPIFVYDEDMKKTLLSYFKNIYKEFEFYAFLSPEASTNPMNDLTRQMFQGSEEEQINITQDITRLLASKSTNKSIKPGQLIIAKIEELIIQDEVVNAIAIVKSESLQSFLKTNIQNQKPSLQLDKGIYVKKIDKACLILDSHPQDGYRMCIKDNTSKPGEAAIFWKTDFLNAGIKMDDYQYTQVYMEATDKFINDYQSDELPIDKEQEITIKNRSAQYFNDTEEFNWDEYKESVFQEPELQEAFSLFKDKMTSKQNTQVPESFSVSPNAVQSNNKFFRSVIKLDRNFSLYVHGNRNMIERGVDEEGRKYYKLYYDEEK